VIKPTNALLKAANPALRLLCPTLKAANQALKPLYLLLSCVNGSSCLYEWKTASELLPYAAEHRVHGNIKIRRLLGLTQALGPASAGPYLPTSLER
jgi:hypothetical protein